MRYFLILLFLLSPCLQAQDSTRMHLLFKAGINANYFSGSYYQEYESHRAPGFKFGIGFELKSDDLNTAGLELSYNERNALWGRGFIDFSGGDYVIYRLKYVSIKPYYRLKSNIGNLFKNFYVEIGMPLSYNLSARQEWHVEMDEFWGDWEVGPENIRSEINKFEAGIFYALSFPFVGPLSIDFSFYQAISHLYGKHKIYEDDLKNKEDFKNHSFSVSFTYRIPIAK